MRAEWKTALLASLALVAAACGGAESDAENKTDKNSEPMVAQAANNKTKGWPMSFEKPTDDVLKKQLTELQYKVTQEEGTEPAFRNDYWDNHEDGIYVDVVSGEPLFSSLDKFDSGTGWPSFTRPLAPENVSTSTDYHIGVPRTEVRSKHADSHLGHVFDDGPKPTGQRYCMNSAALRFIPVSRLAEEGYEQYLPLFEGKGTKNP